MSGKYNKKSRYIKKEKETQKANLKYIVIALVIVFCLGLFFINTGKGKAFINSIFTNKNAYKEISISTNNKEELSNNTENTNQQIVQNESSKYQPDVDTPKNAEIIKILISDLDTQAQFFSYRSKNNLKIKYFALLDKNGNPHVAFDACDVCYRAKKGYAQQNDLAVCRNCGRRYPIEAIGTKNIQGGCWPSYLPIIIKENEIIISPEDIEKKEYMFL